MPVGDIQLSATSYFRNALSIGIQPPLSPKQIVRKLDALDQREHGDEALEELGQIVSSLDSYDLASSSDPELQAATVRALDRSRSEVVHPDYNSEQRSKSIMFIAFLAIIQFYRTGELEDVNESIQALVELCNGNAAVQPDCHRATAQTFLKRFDLTRNIEDLNKACEHFEHERQLHPNAALERFRALNSLGTVLSMRFSLLGRREDLKRAIKSHEEALMIRRTDPDAGTSLAFQLEELANDLVKEFEEFEEPSRPEGIFTAINYLREALELRSPRHPFRNHSLTCLCRALAVCVHRQVSNAQLIDNYLHWIAELISEVLNVDGQSSDQEPVERIAVLAFTARVIAERGGSGLTSLVQHIVEYLSQAINGVDDNHPCFVGIYQNTAVLYLKSFELDKAFQHFKKAAKHRLGILRERLSAAVEWAAEARGHQHKTTEDAYKTAMDLLDRCQITYMTVDAKHEFLAHHLTAKEASSLSSDAASFAIEKGHLKEAVEILERGRTFVWATMRGYRTELGELRSVIPSLANKFASLSTKLERFAVLSTKVPSSHPTHPASLAPLDDRAVRDGNVLRDEWDATVKDIRNELGFRGFLKPPSFDGLHGLRQAAAEGPVVMLNLSNNYKADALILLPSTPIIPVSLGKPEDIVELIQDYAKLGSRIYLPKSNSSSVQIQESPNDTQRTHSTLSFLLKRCSGLIMNFVKAALLNAGVASKSRIWLCPTGLITLLPLHAAGVPVFDHISSADPYFIPSYTPSLSALITARLNTRGLHPDPELLIVGASMVPGLPDLPYVETECRIVRELVPNGRDLLGTSASRKELLKWLPRHSWAHFACHGLHNDNAPFESAFMLYDGTFTLRDIMATRRGCAGFAFLSACETATPSSLLPDEVLHLCAGIQFCGFSSVVGTQWPVMDDIAADLAQAFYKELFRGGKKAHLTYSAEALHASLMLLKNRGKPVEYLVPFIHVGV